MGAGFDEVIPIGHARNLYDSVAGSAKRMWTIRDAGHNDWTMHVNQTWWREVMGFVSIKSEFP